MEDLKGGCSYCRDSIPYQVGDVLHKIHPNGQVDITIMGVLQDVKYVTEERHGIDALRGHGLVKKSIFKDVTYTTYYDVCPYCGTPLGKCSDEVETPPKAPVHLCSTCMYKYEPPNSFYCRECKMHIDLPYYTWAQSK